MFRASPRTARKRLLRRLTAGVVGAVLGVTLIAEPLLADVCDGDAPAAARMAVVPHQDLSPVGADDATGTPISAVRAVETADAERSDAPATPTA